MTAAVWELYVSKAMADWQSAGTYPTLAEAALRITALERLPNGRLCLETHVDPDTSDDDALAQFVHTGLTDVYSIRRTA